MRALAENSTSHELHLGENLIRRPGDIERQHLKRPIEVAHSVRRRGVFASGVDGVILVFPGTIDEQSPAFTRAAAVCRFPLHNH